jgi:hypothetical protein
MKLIVSIIKPGQGEVGKIEIDDPQPGDLEAAMATALEAARLAAPHNTWPLRIDISEVP